MVEIVRSLVETGARVVLVKNWLRTGEKRHTKQLSRNSRWFQ
jgi:hypothetical protein